MGVSLFYKYITILSLISCKSEPNFFKSNIRFSKKKLQKKGKAKISKVKRNNQTTNKMKKQGKLKLQRHRTKVLKNKQPVKPQVEYESDSGSASGEEWADMLDDEEQKYIMSRLTKQPQLLSNVPDKEPAGK